MTLDVRQLKGRAVLAPLAGVADSSFRLICREMGAAMVFTEMISADGLVQQSEKTYSYLFFRKKERPIGFQLFGSNPDIFARAMEIVLPYEPDFIDINFGCPVKKVVRKEGGASLMRDPKLAGEIAREVVRASGLIPVTAKIRSGWSAGTLNYLEVAEELVSSGISALALHPRTREQGFSGRSDWRRITRLVRFCPVPVIGSGDVFTPADVLEMFDTTGCAAVMIGRGAVGNPWIFSRAKSLLAGKADPGEPGREERISLALEHTQMMVREHDEKYGVVLMRKHFGCYTKGLPAASELRRRLFACSSMDEVKRTFGDYLEKVQNLQTG